MSNARTDLQGRIVSDPNIMLGKPTVRGTRIPVELVLEQLSYNLDPEELIAAYPRLSEDDVKACIAYAQRALKAKRLRTLTHREQPAGAHSTSV